MPQMSDETRIETEALSSTWVFVQTWLYHAIPGYELTLRTYMIPTSVGYGPLTSLDMPLLVDWPLLVMAP